MEEIWKDIQGYEGLYQVSNLGRIKSLPRVVCSKRFCRKTNLKYIGHSVSSGNDYMRVELMINGNVEKVKIHRLVAKAFIPNPENKPEINHKNGIKNDNRVENLEWVTASENQKHSFRVLGRKITTNNFKNYDGRGENNKASKLKTDNIYDIFDMYRKKHKVREIAEKYNVSIMNIYRVLKRTLWKHIEINEEL